MRTLSTVVISLSLVTISGTSNAQCEAALPANAITIQTDGEYDATGWHWVCAGVTASLTGFGAFAVIEPGATVTVEGSLGAYLVKGNATLIINGGNSNVNYTSAANIIDNGTNTFLNLCDALEIDYSNAPSPGCDIIASTPGIEVERLSVYPNPTVGQLFIDPAGEQVEAVQVLDMSGRVQRSAGAVRAVDLSGLAAGNYLVNVFTGSGVVKRMIAVN